MRHRNPRSHQSHHESHRIRIFRNMRHSNAEMVSIDDCQHFLLSKGRKTTCLTSFLSRNGNEKRTSKMDVLFFGGDKRDRTADLLNAIQALSRASNPPCLQCDTYIADFQFQPIAAIDMDFRDQMADNHLFHLYRTGAVDVYPKDVLLILLCHIFFAQQ